MSAAILYIRKQGAHGFFWGLRSRPYNGGTPVAFAPSAVRMLVGLHLTLLIQLLVRKA